MGVAGQRPEGSDGESQVDLWGKGIPDRRNIKCKGSEVGTRQVRVVGDKWEK